MEYTHHFGVYALILDAQKESILLIRKARGPYTGQYDLPGGSMEPGELLEETVVREVKEETGCDFVNFHQVQAVCARYPFTQENKEYVLRHVGVLYIGQIQGTPMQTGDGLDSNGAEWIALVDIPQKETTPFVRMGLDCLNIR